MKRLFLLMTIFAIALSAGCQDTPQGDPNFKKEKVDMEKLKPKQGEKLQQAPPE